MNDDSDRARTIFFAALELPSPDAVQQHLELACAGDGALRGRVEELLADHRAAVDRDNGSSDVAPDESTAPHALLAERPGTVIGGYKLLQQIGEGGMGVVFMAEQSHPIQRTVALKIIKPGMDSRQIIARFSAERQAVALMDHPNIARVLDAGTTESGRPYFVMELVKGLPLTEYCDAHRLTPRERLQLFVPVCQAVQHAHQKGVIHRDLKPSNVLVAEYDSRAVPKIIDFGVAKAIGQRLTEQTLFTQYGQIVGTFEYMSPEQAKLNQLDVDTRSDIYSLGVLLYELLAGSTPFEKKRLRSAAFEEILRIIREEDPPRPSTRLSALSRSGLPGRIAPPGDPARQAGPSTLETIAANRGLEPAKLSGLIRGELDWIVMKCLEKERSRRYETANGLARDLERYLDGETVLACPPSAAYRFRKFARRNKAGLVLASGVIAALLMLIVGLIANNRMIAAERNEKAAALRDREQALADAKASAVRAEEERARAEQERYRAEDSFTKARAVVASILGGPALGQGQWADLSPEHRKLFAAEAIKYYETLVQEGSAEPAVQYETAVGYRSLGFMFQNDPVRDDVRAEELVRKSIAILEELLRDDPNDALYRQQLGWSSWVLAHTLRRTERLAEAETCAARAAELYEALLAEAPADADYLNEIQTVYATLGGIRGEANRAPEAIAAYLRLIAIYEQAVAHAEDPSLRPTPPFYPQRGLVVLLVEQGQWPEVLAQTRQVLAWDPNRTDSWMWAASLQLQAGETEGYRQVAREMFDQFGDSDSLLALERTAKTCALAPGVFDDPLELVALADRVLEGNETHRSYWYFVVAKGLAEFRAGHDATAIYWMQRTSPNVLRSSSVDAMIYSVIAMSQHRLGQPDEARITLEGARTILDGRYPPADDGSSALEAFEPGWMNAQILYREAVETLAAPPPSAED